VVFGVRWEVQGAWIYHSRIWASGDSAKMQFYSEELSEEWVSTECHHPPGWMWRRSMLLWWNQLFPFVKGSLNSNEVFSVVTVDQWSAAAYLVSIGMCSAHPLLAHGMGLRVIFFSTSARFFCCCGIGSQCKAEKRLASARRAQTSCLLHSH